VIVDPRLTPWANMWRASGAWVGARIESMDTGELENAYWRFDPADPAGRRVGVFGETQEAHATAA
jgi:hypothetical protein